MRALPILIAAAALSACAGSQYQEQIRAEGEKDLAEALDGYVATGETEDCIDQKFASGPQIIGNTALLYRQTGGTIWRNDLIGSCPSLREGQTIIVEIKTGRLCRNDMFRTLDPGGTIPSGYCRMGPFKEYKKVAS